MALTKDDLNAISNIVDGKIEELAVITNNGFQRIEKLFSESKSDSKKKDTKIAERFYFNENKITQYAKLETKDISKLDNRLTIVEKYLAGLEK